MAVSSALALVGGGTFIGSSAPFTTSMIISVEPSEASGFTFDRPFVLAILSASVGSGRAANDEVD